VEFCLGLFTGSEDESDPDSELEEPRLRPGFAWPVCPLGLRDGSLPKVEMSESELEESELSEVARKMFRNRIQSVYSVDIHD
jgi:hypothetical protein